MANMKEVNKAIKKTFPSLDVYLVKGSGYVYYDGEDGFDKIDSLYSNPVSTKTADMIKMAIEDINNVYGEEE